MIIHPQKQPLEDVQTSGDKVNQVWQELSVLRFTDNNSLMSSYLNQAQNYYLDGLAANWRSSGLLYYYSFMNLAKALIAKKELLNKGDFKGKVCHGLQDINESEYSGITGFELSIRNNKTTPNVFPLLYQAVIGSEWPFTEKITIELKDIIPFCYDIGDELKSLFQIQAKVTPVQSLLRTKNNEWWIEVLAPTEIDLNGHSAFQDTQKNDISINDRQDWLISLRVDTGRLMNEKTKLYRTKKFEDPQEAQDYFIKTMVDHYAPIVNVDIINAPWLFVDKITLNGEKISWHPILSDYIFSFALSSILRYSPYNFDETEKDVYISQSWCSQSALTALRYFLIFLKNRRLTFY